MSIREHMVRDAAVHLSDEVREVFFRHLTVLRSAGYSTTEASAVVLAAVEKLASVAVGLAIAHVPPSAREGTAERVIRELCSGLRRRVPNVIGRVRTSESRFEDRAHH